MDTSVKVGHWLVWVVITSCCLSAIVGGSRVESIPVRAFTRTFVLMAVGSGWVPRYCGPCLVGLSCSARYGSDCMSSHLMDRWFYMGWVPVWCNGDVIVWCNVIVLCCGSDVDVVDLWIWCVYLLVSKWERHHKLQISFSWSVWLFCGVCWLVLVPLWCMVVGVPQNGPYHVMKTTQSVSQIIMLMC